MCENGFEHQESPSDPSYPYFSPMYTGDKQPFCKRVSRGIVSMITRFFLMIALWLIFLYALYYFFIELPFRKFW